MMDEAHLKAKEKGLESVHRFRQREQADESADLSLFKTFDMDVLNEDESMNFVNEQIVNTDATPLELVRQALHSLPSVEISDNSSLANILQRLEDALDTTGMEHSRKKLINTFNSTIASEMLKDEYHDESVVSRQFGSPTFSTSRISRSRSACADNHDDTIESETAHYEAIIEDLANKLNEMCQEKEDLQSICASLGDKLQKLGRENEEKIAQITSQFEEEKQNMHLRVDRLTKDLEIMKAKYEADIGSQPSENNIEEVILANEQLQLKLITKSKIIADANLELESTRSKLEDAMQEIDRLKLIEVNHSVTHKILQIDSDGEIELLRSKVGELEDIIEDYRSKNEELGGTLSTEQEKLALLHDTLSDLVSKCEMKDRIIEVQQKNMQDFSSQVGEEKNQFEIELRQSKSMNETLLEEIASLRLHLDDAVRREDALRSENHSIKSAWELAGQHNDPHLSSPFFMIEEETRIKNNTCVSSEAFNDLKSKLSLAERKAEFLSSERAKSFALSSRVIAYLESECIRFKSLCDHYRSTNAKLSLEMKSMQMKVFRASDMEHQFGLTKMNEQLLMSKLVEMKKSFVAKCAEEKLVSDNLRNLRAEIESTNNCRLSVDEERLRELEVKCRNLQDEKLLLEENLRCEEDKQLSVNDALQRAYAELENQLKAKINMLTDNELECNNLRTKVSELELQLSESCMRLSLVEEQHKATVMVFERNLTDVRSEIALKDNLIGEQRIEIENLKNQIVVVENQSIQSGQQLSSNLLQLSREIDENRVVRQDVDEKNREMEDLKRLLQDKERQHKHLQSQIVALETSKAQNVQQLSEMKDLLRAKDDENRILRQECDKSTKETQSLRSTLNEIQNSADQLRLLLVTVQQENSTLMNFDAHSRSMQNTLTDENHFLRESLETLASEKSKLNMQVIDLVQELADKTDELTQLERELLSEKQKVVSLNNVLQAVEERVVELSITLHEGITVFKVFIDKLGLEDLSTSFLLVDPKDQSILDSLAAMLTLTKSFGGVMNDACGRISGHFLMRLAAQVDMENTNLRILELQMENAKLQDEVNDTQELLQNVKIEFERLRTFSIEQEARHDADRQQIALNLQSTKFVCRSHSEAWMNLLREVSEVVSSETLVDNELFDCLMNESSLNECSNVDVLNVTLHDYQQFVVSCALSLRNKLANVLNEFKASEAENLRLNNAVCELKDSEEQQIESKNILQAEVELLRSSVADLESKMETRQHQLEEYSSKFNALTEELEATLKVNSELIRSLSEAETVCQELNTTVALIQAEGKTRDEKLEASIKSQDALKSKLHQYEVQSEKLSLSNSRLKSEKDALENVRKSLEAELDRCRQDLLLLQSRHEELDLAKCTFEVEKLLNAVSSCAETCALTWKGDDSFDGISNERWEIFLQNKSRHGVIILNQISSKMREDLRQHKIIESNLHVLVEDLRHEKLAAEIGAQASKDREAQLVSTIRGLEHELTSLSTAVSEHESLRSKLVEYEAEVDNRIKAIEGLKNENVRYSLLCNQLETEIGTMRGDLDERNAHIKQLQDQFLKEKEQRNVFLAELEFRKNQVETMNKNIEQVLLSLKLSEKMLGEEKERRIKCEHDLKNNDVQSILSAEFEKVGQSLRDKDLLISELEAQIRERESEVEHVLFQKDQELSRLQQLVEKCGVELSSCHAINTSLDKELLTVRGDLDTEKSCRAKLEVTLETLQKTMAEERRRSLESTISGRVDLETKLANCSLELTSLKSTVRELNRQVAAKQNEMTINESTLAQQQKQLISNQSRIDQLLKFNSEANERCEKLQTELFGMKTFIQKIEGGMREVVVKLKLDMSEVRVPGQEDLQFYVSKIHLGVDQLLEEARQAKAQLSKAQALQLEISTLRLKLHGNDNQFALLPHSEPARTDVGKIESDKKVQHLLNQVKVFEEALRVEASGKAAAIEELRHVKSLMEKQMLDNKKLENLSKGGHDVRELDEMKRECERLQSQVKSMMIHESKLASFVRELDTSFLQRVNRVVEDQLSFVSKSSTSWSQIDNLRKEVRCKVLEDLFGCIVRFVIASLSDTKKADVAIHHCSRFPILCSQLMADQVGIIASGYEHEIRALETIANEFCKKWQDSQAYVTELDRQVEDQMKQLYRVGKSDASSALRQQFDTLRAQTEDCQASVHFLQSELVELRKRSSESVGRLVRDLALEASKRSAVVLYATELECLLRDRGVAVNEDLLRNFQQKEDVAVATLVRNLAETDHDLQESERRYRRSSSVPMKPTSSTSTPVETFLVNKKPSHTVEGDRRSNAQVMGLPVSKNSKGTSSLRINKGSQVGVATTDDRGK